jgi:hypothetical protein
MFIKPTPTLPFPSKPSPSFPSRPPVPIRPVLPIHPGPTTLSLEDRLNARGLRSSLERRLSGVAGAVQLAKAPEATLRRGLNGQMLGPEGQPLATVRLANGRTAYVDPNTNQYYVAEKNPLALFKAPGSVRVRGPLPLPADAEFSNSHFSAADVAAIGKIAAGASGIRPQPRDDSFMR